MSSTARPFVEIDFDACDRLAHYLGSVTIPPDREESALPGVPTELVGNFFLALVAICHQTTPQNGEPAQGVVGGELRRGWDYLFGRFELAASVDRGVLEPTRWVQMTRTDIRLLFRDSEFGDTLTGLSRRAELLRDLGKHMLSSGWRRAEEIRDHCGGRVATDNPNLLETLGSFRAYADPIRKKSLFFLALMRNTELWRYEDDQELGPPVDYHEVRGHLRLGTVRITDHELAKKLREGLLVTGEEDEAIRRAVYDVIIWLANRHIGANPSQLHYLFWNLFRNICTRDSPKCLELGQGDQTPERYMHLVRRADGGGCCPFSSFCPSARTTIRLREHVFDTDYY